MASVEQRGTRNPHWRVVWRENDVRESEKFPTPEQARYYCQLVTANGNRRVAIAPPEPVASAPDVAVVGSGCTFAVFSRLWIDTFSGPRPLTLQRYRKVIERDLIPAFGHLDMAALTRQLDSAWVRQQQDAGASPKTIRNRHALLSQIVDAAVEHEPVPLLARNPMTARLPEANTPEQRFLTVAEFARLEEAIHPHYRVYVRFLVATGLRWGEGAGLLVGRVRLLDDPPAVDVRQSWQLQPGGIWALSPLKTKSSKRSVRLSAEQVNDLVPLVAPHLDAGAFVFRSTTGQPLNHGYFYRAYWQPAIREAGLDGLRIHDLRHTHVAWLIAANISLPVIMRRLGHSSITTTMNQYGHLLPEVDASAADAMQRALVRP